MEPDFPALAPGTMVAGKLRIVRLLGMGGMGAVYEVEHEITKHRRALKLLHPQFKAYPHVIERFLREASAAGRIGNPHIAETFDAGEFETGEPYLVMELLHGQTLAGHLEKHGELSLGEAADLMRQACTGVQAAHDAGIVHRDLKPDNLFIVEKEGRPFVKILDFGVSKFDSTITGGLGMTQEGATLGTPFYMPPEQIRGDKHIDARADIYALGVILYECVGGNRPFTAETLAHLAVLIHEGRPVPITELRPDLPARFAEVVHKAMAKDRDLRQTSARELAEALASFTPQVLGPTVGWPGRGQAPPEPASARMVQPSAKVAASASYGSGIAIPESKIPRRSLLPVVLVSVGVAIAGAVFFVVNRPDDPPKPVSTGLATGNVLAATVAPEGGVSPEVLRPPPETADILPLTAATGSESKLLPMKPLPSNGTSSNRAGEKTPVRPDDSAKNKSRVEQRGLVKDNPFK